MTKMYHNPVLLEACLEGLALKESGTYVDVTFGGGGHTKAILDSIGRDGKVIAFDQDEDAIENSWEDERLIFIHQNFTYLQRFLRFHKIDKVDGILADLGVSSHQIDTPTRGFSTRFDGPLDMRMSSSEGTSAKEVINSYTKEQLSDIFYQYGELTNARKFASRIVECMKQHPWLCSILDCRNGSVPLDAFYVEMLGKIVAFVRYHGVGIINNSIAHRNVDF